MTALPPLGEVDWALLAVLAVSVIFGLMRGVVFELMSLLGWGVAYFGAQWIAPQLAPRLPVGEPGSGANHAAAFALAFIGVLLAWMILARLARMLVSATPLTLIDRVLGAGFGLLRGAFLLLVLATVVALTPAAHSPLWQGSQGVRMLAGTLRGIKPLLPPQVLPLLPV